MPGIPCPECELLPDLLQKIRQRIARIGVRILLKDLCLHRRRQGMGQDIVHPPAACIQIAAGFVKFCFCGHLLRPPACSFLAPLLVMAFRAAHDENALAVNGVYLSAQQMAHAAADLLHLPAHPFRNGKRPEHLEIFVISVKEQRCIRLFGKPVTPVAFLAAVIPEQPEIPADDQIVLLRQRAQQGIYVKIAPGEAVLFFECGKPVQVACHIDHGILSFPVVMILIIAHPPGKSNRTVHF